MSAMREGYPAAITDREAAGELASEWSAGTATDALSTLLLSVRSRELQTQDCAWSTRDYVRRSKMLAE